MTGIFGFLGSNARNAYSCSQLFEMLHSHLGVPSNEYTHTCNKQSAGILACASQYGTTYSLDNIHVAVTGNPNWSGRSDQSSRQDSYHIHAIAQAFRESGTELLKYLHGSFALAIFDSHTGQALIAVDRMGTCPLAFSVLDNALVVASSADNMLAHPDLSRELDPQGLFNYLYFHMVPSPGSIYKSIEKLLPGEYLFFDDGKITRSFYWQIEYLESDADEKQLSSELLTLLENSVRHCLTEKATGAFLSGGLDSSTVAGMLAKLSDKKTDVYGIGFDAKGYDEMGYARASAHHFKANLHEYYVTPQDVIDAIPRIAAAYDEPFGNASAIPAYYCARLAKQDGMACLLAGDGGDEIFAGNERYARQLLLGAYEKIPALLRHRLIEPLFLETLFTKRVPLLSKVCSYIEQARQPMPDRMQTYNFLHRSALTDVFSADFLAEIRTDDPLINLRKAFTSSGTDSVLKRMMHMDLKFTLADNDLRKVSRMCELAGIEVRYPLLDEELVAFSARVPSRLLIRRGELRSFYRRSLRDFLAPDTLDKNKHGFGLPFGVWMTEHAGLRELAYDSLADFSNRGYLRNHYIDQLIKEHRGSHAGYYGVMIWVIMMLEQWLVAHAQ